MIDDGGPYLFILVLRTHCFMSAVGRVFQKRVWGGGLTFF